MNAHSELLDQNGYIYPFQTSWFDLPLEMREMVILEMDLKTRCNFSECSKTCGEEVIKIMTYDLSVHSILTYNSREILKFEINHDFDDCYVFEFEKFKEKQTIVRFVYGSHTTTTIVNEKPIEIRTKYLNYLFKKYNHSICWCNLLDQNVSTTLSGIKIDLLTNLDEFELQIWPRTLESIYEAGIITEDKLCQIKTIKLDISQNDAYKIALSFKGNQAHMECERTFDINLFYQFLFQLKNEGTKESNSVIKFCFDGRIIDYSILIREIFYFSIINTWDEIDHDGTICEIFEFETETSQRIRVIWKTYEIDVKF